MVCFFFLFFWFFGFFCCYHEVFFVLLSNPPIVQIVSRNYLHSQRRKATWPWLEREQRRGPMCLFAVLTRFVSKRVYNFRQIWATGTFYRLGKYGLTGAARVEKIVATNRRSVDLTRVAILYHLPRRARLKNKDKRFT